MFFSIIIPTYNREKEISRALNSVLTQTFQDFEIIVVDDGSTDNTESVVLSFNDIRIKYIKQDNSGATAARNYGIRNSSGQYIAFLDSDDMWYPTFLEEHKAKYEEDNELCVTYSNLNIINEKGEVFPFSKPLGLEGYVYRDVLIQGYLSPTITLTAKIESLKHIGMFDVDMPASQDDDICFRLSKIYKVGYINKILAAAIVSSGDRISSSANRVALGWWKLWTKNETDVISLCGCEVMSRHYLECVRNFALAGNKVLTNEALGKFEKYGGKLNVLSRTVIYISLKSERLRNLQNGRILRKLLMIMV
jgi:glycosyltransferase involved in cell wall biosynthesis